jgi:prepilin-type N-terminal cleavage/methylation domain-containing protein
MDEIDPHTTACAKNLGRPRAGRGFTLVELMIAMMILAGGLLTMATVQIQSMKGGQRGRHLTQASVVAASQLEQLQRERWTNIPATAWTSPVSAAAIVNRTDLDQDYTVSWRITSLTANQTRALDVRVSWAEPSGEPRSVMISSIRNNHEGL